MLLGGWYCPEYRRRSAFFRLKSDLGRGKTRQAFSLAFPAGWFAARRYFVFALIVALLAAFGVLGTNERGLLCLSNSTV
jgi:hypothetical protein